LLQWFLSCKFLVPKQSRVDQYHLRHIDLLLTSVGFSRILSADGKQTGKKWPSKNLTWINKLWWYQPEIHVFHDKKARKLKTKHVNEFFGM
jgi:hypothetical protein